jgi:hypothetical protein
VTDPGAIPAGTPLNSIETDSPFVDDGMPLDKPKRRDISEARKVYGVTEQELNRRWRSIGVDPVEHPKRQYWIHPESDCLFTTDDGKHPGDTCEELTREEYERFEAEGATRTKEPPAVERRKVYHPRKLIWVWSDTGKPCDEPTQVKPRDRVYILPRGTRLNSETIMPFGDYNGYKLSEVPSGYLRFCLDKLSSMRQSLREAIEQELLDREGRE